jgi:hypothetical protein
MIRIEWYACLGTAFVIALGGCGSDKVNQANSGGTSSTGGTTSSAGTTSAAGTISSGGTTSSAGTTSNAGWIHPGALDSAAQLAFVKAQIKANAPPWIDHFNAMKPAFAVPGAETIPALNNADPNSKTNEDAQKQQAQRAYGNALAYWYTDDTTYADQAVAILKAWSNVEPYVVYNGTLYQSMLDGAWIGTLLGPAAELVRNYMSPADLAQVQAMFKTVFIPSLSVMDPSNGNRDLTQIDAMFSIAVFCEDRALFESAQQRLAYRIPGYIYLQSDGATPKASIPGAGWYSPNYASPNSNGLMQESCRDFDHHTQYAMAAFLAAAEVAWNQGVDLYAQYQDRFTAGMELIALQMTSGTMQGVCTNGDTTTADVYNTFEIGYNHYHNVVGLALPNTAAVLPRIRESGQSQWNIFYETLTHAGN